MARTIEFDREDILNKCMLLFWERGYESTSIADIENQTGIIRTSLYNSFGNKEKIYVEVLNHFINTQCQYWTKILLGAETFLKGLDNLLSTMIKENFDSNAPTGCLITYSAAGIDNQTDEVKETIKLGHTITLKGIKKGLNSAIASGELNKNTDVENLALFILNNFQGIMVLSKTVGNKKSLQVMKNFTLNAVSQNAN